MRGRKTLLAVLAAVLLSGCGPTAHLFGWGVNNDGALGIGSADPLIQTTPKQLGTADTWQSVSSDADTSASHSCGIQNDGTLWCWGHNDSYELGDGTNQLRMSPTRIGADNDWASVDAGTANATCAVKTDGTGWCWGSRLGEDGFGVTQVPTRVDNTTSWKFIAVGGGGSFSCGLRTDSTLWCWGANDQGYLGDGTTTPHVLPLQVDDARWKSLSVGNNHSCGVQSDATLWCWGFNGFGALGDGSTTDRHAPHQVGTATNWSSVSAGFSETCGLRSSGELLCWGENDDGELGTGTTDPAYTPTRVGGPNGSTNWTAVSSGNDETCAIRADTTLWCSGFDATTQVAMLLPRRVGTDTGWLSVNTGWSRIYGTRGAGSLAPEWWPLRGTHELGCTSGNPSPAGPDSCVGYHPYAAMDIDATTSDTVYAAGSGVVQNIVTGQGGNCDATTHTTEASCPNGSKGNSVVVAHTLTNGAKVYSQYLHLASVASGLAVGAQVTQDTALGQAGQSGLVTPGYVHLHFAVSTDANNFQQSAYWYGLPLKACVAGVRKLYPGSLGAGYPSWLKVPRNTLIRSDGTNC